MWSGQQPDRPSGLGRGPPTAVSGAGSRLGFARSDPEDVSLAPAPAIESVGPVDFEYLDTSLADNAGHRGPKGAGALDAHAYQCRPRPRNRNAAW